MTDDSKGSDAKGTDVASSNRALGYLALAMLCSQNTAVVLLTKYTQLPGKARYSSVVVVMLTEAMKLAICCALVAFEENGLWAALRDKVCRSLASVAAAVVDAPSFAICSRAAHPRRERARRRRWGGARGVRSSSLSACHPRARRPTDGGARRSATACVERLVVATAIACVCG